MSKKNTQQENESPAAQDAAPARTRKPREKTQYLLETANGNEWSPTGTGSFDDVAEAVKHVADNKMTGDFRVIAVKRTFKAELTQAVSIV